MRSEPANVIVKCAPVHVSLYFNIMFDMDREIRFIQKKKGRNKLYIMKANTKILLIMLGLSSEVIDVKAIID